MSEEPQSAISATGEPVITAEPSANLNSAQGYHVPAKVMADHNQPSRWRWFGINCFAFIVSCLIFPMFVILCMFLLRLGKPFMLKPQNNLTEGLSILFMVGIPILLTIYLASMLQWVVIGERINWLGWSLHSAIVGTLCCTITCIVSSYAHISNNLWLAFLIFGVTATGIGIIQSLKLRPHLAKPWHWLFITSITWTGLGTFVIGFWLGQLLEPLSDL